MIQMSILEDEWRKLQPALARSVPAGSLEMTGITAFFL